TMLLASGSVPGQPPSTERSCRCSCTIQRSAHEVPSASHCLLRKTPRSSESIIGCLLLGGGDNCPVPTGGFPKGTSNIEVTLRGHGRSRMFQTLRSLT